jgi:DNA replication protein DnaC
MIVLNYRMQNNKLTFINSNISMEQLSRKYASILKRTGNSFNAERLMERIKALTNNTEFELKGKDMRY